jgi:hypothetical protein
MMDIHHLPGSLTTSFNLVDREDEALEHSMRASTIKRGAIFPGPSILTPLAFIPGSDADLVQFSCCANQAGL